MKSLKSIIEPWETAFKKYQEAKELSDVLTEEDKGLTADLAKNIDLLLSETEKIEFQTLLDQEFDKHSAILSINAGAGGTESCDWVSMLLRDRKAHV